MEKSVLAVIMMIKHLFEIWKVGVHALYNFVKFLAVLWKMCPCYLLHCHIFSAYVILKKGIWIMVDIKIILR